MNSLVRLSASCKKPPPLFLRSNTRPSTPERLNSRKIFFTSFVALLQAKAFSLKHSLSL